MSKEYFDAKYKSKGGLNQLKEMMDKFATQSLIAKHFGVTKERVRQWAKQYFGMRYDPRYSRKREKIENIKTLFHQYGAEKTIKILGDKNSYYIEKALKEYKIKQ